MKDETEINALALLGADPDVREIAALEKLRRAAKVAPLARSLSEKQRARKLRTESGAVVTHGEILDAQLRRDQIEIDVVSPPDRNEAVNVLCGWGLSLEEIDGLTAREITALAARKMGDSAPSLATVGRLVRRIRGRSRLPRGSSPPQPPHHESRERLRLALATPCSGCGKSPSKRVAERGRHRLKVGPWVWVCRQCAGMARRSRERPTAPCACRCGALPRENSKLPSSGPWLCQRCATRRAQASLSGAALARARSGYRDWWASLSEEQRQAERAKRAKPRKTKP